MSDVHVTRAKRWLRNYLSDGAWHRTDKIKRAVEKTKFWPETIVAAADVLDLEQRELDGKVSWRLPASMRNGRDLTPETRAQRAIDSARAFGRKVEHVPMPVT